MSIKTLKEVPKGWFEKSKYDLIYLAEDIFLARIHKILGLTEYVLIIDGEQTLIPKTIFIKVLNSKKYGVKSFYKYSYLDEDYNEYYVIEDKNSVFMSMPQ